MKFLPLWKNYCRIFLIQIMTFSFLASIDFFRFSRKQHYSRLGTPKGYPGLAAFKQEGNRLLLQRDVMRVYMLNANSESYAYSVAKYYYCKYQFYTNSLNLN